jgi:hypothetical protein
MQKVISEMTELILFEWSQHKENTANPEMRLMCARGLLMLMCLAEIGDFDWFKISLGIMTAFKEVYNHAERLEMRSEKLLSNQDLLI